MIEVSEEESISMTQRLAKEEALFAGVSSGGAATAAVQLASNS